MSAKPAWITADGICQTNDRIILPRPAVYFYFVLTLYNYYSPFKPHSILSGCSRVSSSTSMHSSTWFLSPSFLVSTSLTWPHDGGSSSLPFRGLTNSSTPSLVTFPALMRSPGCSGDLWWDGWTSPSSLSWGQSPRRSSRGSRPWTTLWRPVNLNVVNRCEMFLSGPENVLQTDLR